MMLASDETPNTTSNSENNNNDNDKDDDGGSSCGSSSSSSTTSSTTTDKQQQQTLALRIKSFKDVEISLPSASCSVAQVKQVVRKALLGEDQAQDRYLRLICKGQLLAPDSSSLADFKIQNGDVLHAVLAAAGVRGGPQAALSRGNSSTGSSTGGTTTTGHYRRGGGRLRSNNNNGRTNNNNTDSSSEDDYDEEAPSTQQQQQRQRLGFDRLRGTGLSRSEIAAIRAYFSRQVDRFVQAHPELASLASSSDESDPRRRRLLQEDAWMQTQGPTSEFRFNLPQLQSQLQQQQQQQQQQQYPFFMGGSNTTGANAAANTPLFRATSVGTDRDFMWGFLLGFFVGFLMLVWVWMPTVPHKQKLGILAGISFQLAMNFLKTNHGDYDNGDPYYDGGGAGDFVDGD